MSIAAITLIVCSGCGGITASHSVSPATFLLPGFGSVAPEPVAVPAMETNGTPEASELALLN
jgi:hypothetical protein